MNFISNQAQETAEGKKDRCLKDDWFERYAKKVIQEREKRISLRKMYDNYLDDLIAKDLEKKKIKMKLLVSS